MEISKEFLTYDRYSFYISELMLMIRQSDIIQDLKAIYAIPRGGYPIGVHLSHHLRLPLVNNIAGLRKEELLIVDDIADTGITLEKLAGMCKATATIYYKERSTVKPTFYVIKTDKWIVFPWERMNETPNR